MHKDNYENIYVQILGQKHFVLLPPLCQPCVNEQDLIPALYVRDETCTEDLRLRLDIEADGDFVPFATVPYYPRTDPSSTSLRVIIQSNTYSTAMMAVVLPDDQLALKLPESSVVI